MIKSTKAFTMIEIIFVIVIIGILGAVSIPKFVATRDDAKVAKNIEYIVSAMSEILTYTLVRGETKSDLREMSPILGHLHVLNRVTINTNSKSATIKMGEQVDCLKIIISSNENTEFSSVLFSASEDKICTSVQNLIKEKDYPITLRGKLINY